MATTPVDKEILSTLLTHSLKEKLDTLETRFKHEEVDITLLENHMEFIRSK